MVAPIHASSRYYPGGHAGALRGSKLRYVRAIWCMPSGTLWLAIWDKVGSPLLVVEDGRWRRVALHGAAAGEGFGPFLARGGHLWSGGPVLLRYEYGAWQAVRNTPFPPFSHVTALASDGDTLWVGTYGGLWCLDPRGNWQAVPLPGGGLLVTALLRDDDGGLWVAEMGPHVTTRPLHRRDLVTGSWTTLPLPPRPRSFTALAALARDPHGALWVGSSSHGLFRWQDEAWGRFTGRWSSRRPVTLPGSGIGGLCVDRHGRVWAATIGGIGVYSMGEWRPAAALIAQPDGSTAYWIPFWPVASHLDSVGRLWIGTANGQLGWIDTTATDEMVEPANIVPYTPTYVDIAALAENLP